MADGVDSGSASTDIPSTSDVLPAFAGLPSDATGSITFERFVWQAKLAVRRWLATFAVDGPIAVVCEHVEDLVIVERNMFRFAQLKTRDKGSWSIAKICESGHAIHSLVNSYLAADAAGIVASSQFEVWLEGPPSETRETVLFFENPTICPEKFKVKIRQMGLSGKKLADFLTRLRIYCKQPSRESVDAVVMKAIGAAWPQLSYSEIEQLYERLLNAVIAAQTASEPPPTVRAAIRAAQLDPGDDAGWQPIRTQVLTRQQIRALCPPLSAETKEQLLERAAAGQASILELKLVRAGAAKETVEAAIKDRADADIAATLARTGSVDDDAFDALDQRLLGVARSIGNLASLGGSPGATPARPAEHIYSTLMSRPADLNAVDATRVFGGDHRLVVGHLCNLSDQCHFGWGVI